jgi:hypothetical protein
MTIHVTELLIVYGKFPSTIFWCTAHSLRKFQRQHCVRLRMVLNYGCHLYANHLRWRQDDDACEQIILKIKFLEIL